MSRRTMIGIVGGGQLARMTVQAASRLAVETKVLARTATDPAAELASQLLIGDPSSLAALEELARGCDVVTFDHERVDVSVVDELIRRGHVVRPGGDALRFSDKAHQRQIFDRLDLPVPRHGIVEDAYGVEQFARDAGWPVVLKPARGGYDGRGVHVAAGPDEVSALFARPLSGAGVVVVEEFLGLTGELSVVVARRPNGETVVYPIAETTQVDGICVELVAPARIGGALARSATNLALRVAEAVDAVGILAVELFVTADRLVVNEIAPRPHNSAHHTIEGSVTSQFENHVRAVLDWPLGDTALTSPAVAMVNVLGGSDGVDPQSRLASALAVPGVRIHLYGKEPRPGRKLGHVTATADDHSEALERARTAAAALTDTAELQASIA